MQTHTLAETIKGSRYIRPHSKDFNYPTKPTHLDPSQQSAEQIEGEQ